MAATTVASKREKRQLRSATEKLRIVKETLVPMDFCKASLQHVTGLAKFVAGGEER